MNRSIGIAIGLLLLFPFNLKGNRNFYYAQNLNVIQFRNFGDMHFGARWSLYNKDVQWGFAFSRSLAVTVKYSGLNNKVREDVMIDGNKLELNKSQRNLSIGLGYFLSDSINSNIRFGAFADYSMGTVNAKALTKSLKEERGRMDINFNLISISAQVLWGDARETSKFKFGYVARLTRLRFNDISTLPSKPFYNDSLMIRTSNNYWMIDHGLNVVLIGKRLNVNTQLGFSHRISPLKSDSPVMTFLPNFAIGISYCPNLFVPAGSKQKKAVKPISKEYPSTGPGLR